MKISNIPVFAFFLLFITYGCNNKNEEVDNQQSSEVEVLTPDPTHGLRPVDLSDHELDIHIFVPEQFYDDENGYPRFVQPIIAHNLGEAKWEITLPGRSKWHLVIEETMHDSVTVNDEIERLNNYAFFSYNFVEQNDSTLVYAKNLKAEKTTLDSLESLKNAFYHFYCLRKINGYNLSFQSFEMGDFRKLTVDQMLTSAKYSY